MSRALLISLWCLILALPVFGNGNADERGGLIGSDAPAGKRYVYKNSNGTPREMEIFFPPNHDPAKSRARSLILFHGGNWSGGIAGAIPYRLCLLRQPGNGLRDRQLPHAY